MFALIEFLWKYLLLLFFVGIPVGIICDAIDASQGGRGRRRRR